MVKTRTRIAGAALAVTGAAVGVSKYEVLLDYAFHMSSTQEQIIGDAVLRAYGSEATIRCLSREELDNRVWPFGIGMEDKKGAAAPFFLPSLIWLDSSICDNLESFAKLQDKAHLTEEQLRAIRVLAHEYRHTEGTMSESTAECEAAQTAYRLPQVWGADDATSYNIGGLVAQLIAQDTTTSDEYKVVDCYDGGPNDLNLQPAIFPPSQKAGG
jgi:hypothetical protein